MFRQLWDRVGHTVIIKNKVSEPFITKDGICSLENIVLEDPFENIVVEILRQGSRQTTKQCGDRFQRDYSPRL